MSGSNGRRIIFVVNQAVNRTTNSTAAERPDLVLREEPDRYQDQTP